MTKESGEIFEFVLDESLTPIIKDFVGSDSAEFIKNVPIFSVGSSIYSIVKILKEKHSERMFLAFIKALRDNSADIEEFNKLKENKKDKIRSLIISQIDLQSDEIQAEAMAYAIKAYLSNNINDEELFSLVFEIKNINPLLFNAKKSDQLKVVENTHSGFKPILKGNINYVPKSFFYSSPSPGSYGIGAIPSSENHFNNLGNAFHKYIYLPMINKK